MPMRALVAATLALGIPTFQTEAARVLADMRLALGGDAAIAAVQAFSVSGSEATNLDGHTGSAGVEWIAQLPDSFVRVRRLSTPWGNDVDVRGFRGDARIQRRSSVLPDPPDMILDPTQDRAAVDAHIMRDAKHEFARFAIALIGPPAVDPVDVSYEGRRPIAGRPCDLLRLRATDGYTATLAVDATTHLPVSVSWMAAPIVTITSTSVVQTSGPRGATPMPPPPSMPPSLPVGDPTAGMSPVEHQLLFEDFKVADGLNWPHRFIEKVGDRVWTTTRVGKYKLNPKIDPKLFDPARK